MPTLILFFISIEELIKAGLKCLNPKQSTGYDGLRPSVVRQVYSFDFWTACIYF